MELYVDGSSNKKGWGVDILLKNPNEDWIEHSSHFEFNASTNEAKYKVLIVGLELAIKFKAKIVTVYSESVLIVNQVNGTYTATNPVMVAYLEKVKKANKGVQKDRGEMTFKKTKLSF